MAWSGSSGAQTFSRTNGTNTGSTTWQTDDAQSTGITSGHHDIHDQDLSDGINSCLKKDGGNTATANIPMGGFVLTNMGDSTARTQSPSTGQLQDGKFIYYPTVGGTVDVITLSGTAAPITAYTAGQTFRFKAAGANATTTPTVNIDGVGAVTIVRTTGAALAIGEIVSSAIIEITHDGTYFQLRVSAAQVFDTATAMLFVQTAAPTGWTKSTTHNDKALRVVSGTASSGGTTAFSSILAARTIAQANLPNYNLDLSGVTATPSPSSFLRADSLSGTPGAVSFQDNSANQALTITIGGTLPSGGSGTAMDFAIQYVDVIVATKT